MYLELLCPESWTFERCGPLELVGLAPVACLAWTSKACTSTRSFLRRWAVSRSPFSSCTMSFAACSRPLQTLWLDQNNCIHKIKPWNSASPGQRWNSTLSSYHSRSEKEASHTTLEPEKHQRFAILNAVKNNSSWRGRGRTHSKRIQNGDMLSLIFIFNLWEWVTCGGASK